MSSLLQSPSFSLSEIVSRHMQIVEVSVVCSVPVFLLPPLVAYRRVLSRGTVLLA
jgi:hypothetical protein